jgi:hypothetical protein
MSNTKLRDVLKKVWPDVYARPDYDPPAHIPLRPLDATRGTSDPDRCSSTTSEE